jgi:hypothetical protein
MAGQVAYHLLAQAGESRAPWAITTVVSCLPVLVLAMGTALAHMLRGDASARDHRDGRPAGPASDRSPGWSARDQPGDQPDQDHETRTTGWTSPPARTSEPPSPPGPAGPPSPAKDLIPGPPHYRDMESGASKAASATARRVEVHVPEPLGLGEQRHVRLGAPGDFPQGGADRPQGRPECCRLGVAQLIQRQHVPAGQHDKPPGLGRPERVRDPPVGAEVYALPRRRVRPPLEGAAEAIAVLGHSSNCQRAGVSCHPGRRPWVQALLPGGPQSASETDGPRFHGGKDTLAPRTRSRKATDFDGLVTPDRRLGACVLQAWRFVAGTHIDQFCHMSSVPVAIEILRVEVMNRSSRPGS